MSLRMTFRQSSWIGDWTIFYWAWWLAWSPFVRPVHRAGLARARCAYLVGTVLAPNLVGFAWFAVFGGTALNYEIFRGVPLAEAVASNVSSLVFVFDAMPGGAILSVVATILVFVFFVTSGDSATLVLGTTAEHQGNPNPPARVKIIWGVLVAAIALSLLLAGGLNAVQTATIVFALPFALVLVLMAISVTWAIRHDWDEEQKRERALRRRMREMVRGRVDPQRGVRMSAMRTRGASRKSAAMTLSKILVPVAGLATGDRMAQLWPGGRRWRGRRHHDVPAAALHAHDDGASPRRQPADGLSNSWRQDSHHRHHIVALAFLIHLMDEFMHPWPILLIRCRQVTRIIGKILVLRN